MKGSKTKALSTEAIADCPRLIHRAFSLPPRAVSVISLDNLPADCLDGIEGLFMEFIVWVYRVYGVDGSRQARIHSGTPE